MSESKAIFPVGYVIPTNTTIDYLKLSKPTTRIRIMTPILPINRWWGLDGIYYNSTRNCPVPANKLQIDPNTKLPGSLQHTWIFGCWDLEDEAFKLAEVYQRSVITGIMSLISDSQGWGDPTLYNISINKPTASGNRYASYTVTGMPNGYGNPPSQAMIDATGEAWTEPTRWLVSNLMGGYKDLDENDPIILENISKIESYFAGDKGVVLNFFKPSGKDETKASEKRLDAPAEKDEWKIFAEDYHNGKRDEFIPGGGDDVITTFHQYAFNWYALHLVKAPKETMRHMVQNLGYQTSAECTNNDVNRICLTIKDADLDF